MARPDPEAGERPRVRVWWLRWQTYVGLLAGAVVSCSFLEDLERYDRGGAATGTAASASGTGAGGAGGAACGENCAPCTGFGEPALVAEETNGHFGLAVDETTVYWLADGPPGTRLMSAPKEGGPAAPIVATDAGVPTLPSLTADNTTLYWSFFGKKYDTNAGVLQRVGKRGDGPAALTYVVYYSIGALVADGNNVYWPQATGLAAGIHKSPKEAGGNVQLAGGPEPGAIALDASNVYYGDAEEESYFIRRIPKGGAGDAAGNDLATGRGRCMGLALDATHLYWTVDAGSVCSAPLEGGSCEELASGQDSPESILIDDQATYWTTRTSVMCLPRSGGPAIELAGEQAEPRFLASDGESLYWMSEGQGVMRLTR